MHGAGVRTPELVSGAGSNSRNQAWGRVPPEQRVRAQAYWHQHLLGNAAVLLGKKPHNFISQNGISTELREKERTFPTANSTFFRAVRRSH